MKLISKNTLKILVFLIGLTVISAYMVYIYNYVFALDLSRRVQIILLLISVIALIIPWEVLYKLFNRLSKILAGKFFEVISKTKKSYANLIREVKSQSINNPFQSIVSWILVVIVANIINKYFISKIPLGYDFHTVINFIVLLTGIFLSRKIIRVFFAKFFQIIDNVLITNLERNFIRKPNIIKFVIFLMLIGVGVTVMDSWIFKPEEHSASWLVSSFDDYDNLLRSKIDISNLNLSDQTVDGQIEINEFGKYSDLLVDFVQYIDVNNQVIPLSVVYVENSGLKTITKKSGKVPFQVELYGNKYFFPFGAYEGEIRISIKGNWHPFLNPEIETSLDSQINSVNLIMGESTHSNYIDNQTNEQINIFSYKFSLSYPLYFKMLFITIFLILIMFLFVVWKTKDIGQVMVLSIGIFATLYAIKGWVIPNEIASLNSPLLFDRISFIYIVVFLASLVYKYSNQNE